MPTTDKEKTAAAPRNFLDDFNSAIESIEAGAREAGTTLSEVCRETGVSRSSPDRWRRRPPKTVQLVAKMQDHIRALKEGLGDEE